MTKFTLISLFIASLSFEAAFAHTFTVSAIRSMLANANMIYHIQNNITTLDTDTWEFNVTFAEVPDALIRPFRCAYVTIDGDDGIFTRFGYFFKVRRLKKRSLILFL